MSISAVILGKSGQPLMLSSAAGSGQWRNVPERYRDIHDRLGGSRHSPWRAPPRRYGEPQTVGLNAKPPGTIAQSTVNPLVWRFAVPINSGR